MFEELKELELLEIDGGCGCCGMLNPLYQVIMKLPGSRYPSCP